MGVTKKQVKFAQKIQGIDFSKDDEATEAPTRRLRRKLDDHASVSYSVQAELDSNDPDAATEVAPTAISDALQDDDAFSAVTIEAPTVEVEEVQVEVIVLPEDDDDEATEAPNNSNVTGTGDGNNDGTTTTKDDGVITAASSKIDACLVLVVAAVLATI